MGPDERRDEMKLRVMQRWEEMVGRLQIEEQEGRAAKHAVHATPALGSPQLELAPIISRRTDRVTVECFRLDVRDLPCLGSAPYWEEVASFEEVGEPS